MLRVRSLLVFAVLSMFAPGVLPASARTGSPAAVADQTVAYQVDLAHDGLAAGSTLVPPLSEKWRVVLGGSISYPLIAGGRVFVTVLNGGSTGTGLFALDAATGQLLWRQKISDEYDWSNAAYENGTVFVVDYGGMMTAFDAATGAIKWQTQLTGQVGFYSSPVAVDGIVYTIGSGLDFPLLYAVDETTGGVLWSVYATVTGCSPTIAGERVFVSASNRPQVKAFNRLTGDLIWSYTGTGGNPDSGRTAVFHDGLLYARDGLGKQPPGYLFDSRDGTLMARYPVGPAPAFHGDLGFFVRTDAFVRAFDTRTRRVKWTQDAAGLTTAPLVANGVVYMGSDAGQLYALSETTGAILWQTDVGASIEAPEEEYGYLRPLTGLGAGAGLLVVPATDTLIAYGN